MLIGFKCIHCGGEKIRCIECNSCNCFDQNDKNYPCHIPKIVAIIRVNF